MQPPNNNYEAQMALITEDNVNVGSSDDGKDFLILVSWLLALIIVVILCFNSIAGFVIDRISVETQTKIERVFDIASAKDFSQNKEYNKQLNYINTIKLNVLKQDKKLQNKNLPIYIVNDKQINAMLYPNGSIAITTGLLELNPPEEELTFVLAHEIGHYSNKDHLKSISKKILIISLAMILGQDIHVEKVVNGVTEAEFLSHSRKQEKDADLYANNVLIKIYGNNAAAINFMKKLDEKNIEFFTYFSTHPSTKERIRLLETHK